MKIAFILADVDSFHRLKIHFGLAYIAGFLKRNGYNNIRFFTIEKTEDYIPIVRSLSEYKPDIVGFTSIETQFEHVISLSKLIKQNHTCVIVCGGTLPTIYPDCIRDAEYLDGIFVGESEKAFLKFVDLIKNNKDYHSTENFCYYDRNLNSVVKNPLLPLEMELDHIGYPDRDIFDFQGVIDYYGGNAPFMFNRGCVYNCSFCSNHALASVYGKISNTTRRRSVNSCVAEIMDADKKYKFDSIHIWDDLFTFDRNWLYAFLEAYKLNIGKPFMCTTRSNLCDDELFKNLKENGCYRIHMALESGNEFIRNEILNRNISQEAVINSYKLAKKYKLQVSVSSIIGIPFETEDMIMETIRLLGKLKIESAGVNIFYPYRGTKIRQLCERYGMVKTENGYGIKERRESILSLPHLNQEKLYYYRDNFELLVRREESIFNYIKLRAKKAVRRKLNFLKEKF